MARNRYFEDEELDEIQGGSLWRLLGYLAPHRSKVFFALFLVVVSAIATQLGPYLIKIAVDVHMPEKDILGIARVAVLYLAIVLASAVATKLRLLIMVRTGNSVIERLREQVFRHTDRLSFSFFDERPAGKIIVRLMNNIDRLQQVVKHAVVNIVADLFRLLVIFAFMLSISPKLTLVTLSVTPFMAAFVFFLKSYIRRRWESYHKKNSNLNAYTHESFVGIKVTQSFVREQENSMIMSTQLDDNYSSWMSATRMSAMMFPAVLTFNMISLGLVYLIGYRFLGAGEVTLGTMIAFGQYVWMITEPIVNLSTYYNEVLVALAAAVRVFDLLDTEPEITDAHEAYSLPLLEGKVEFDDVHFAYNSGEKVFDGLSFTVDPGETIALVGATGSGKTTIVNLVNRFYDVQWGRILLDGHDHREVSLESLRRQVGVMMQDSFLFSGTIYDNIRYGNLDASYEEVRVAAKSVSALEFIEGLPDGFDTEVFERGSRLSVGQRQLVAFARTVLYDPRILILDEATASIDTNTERLLQHAIDRVLSDRTAFVIAHRLSTIRNADRIFLIDGGAIVETGTHAELVESDGKYRELHEAQFTLK